MFSATTVTTMFAGGNGPDVYTFLGNEEVAVKNGCASAPSAEVSVTVK